MSLYHCRFHGTSMEESYCDICRLSQSANLRAQERAMYQAHAISEQALQNHQVAGEQMMRAAAAQAMASGLARSDAQYATYTITKRPGTEAPQVVEKRVEVLPSVERLAKAIWITDPRVIAFCERKAEPGATFDATTANCERVMEVAWKRDEGGWRLEAEIRADLILRAMPSGSEGG